MTNSVHDLGGTHGFGPVHHSPSEPPFKHEWERLVFGIESSCLQTGVLNLHEIRYATELMDPVAYLASRYYEHWLAGVEVPLVEKGVVAFDEIDRRTRHFLEHPERGAFESTRRRTWSSPSIESEDDEPMPPRFRVGDRVVTRQDWPRGHTRLPRYARGRVGVIVRVGESFELPDLAAHELGDRLEHTYQVRFEGAELWGEAAEPRAVVLLELWESYIELAEETG